MLRLLLPSDTVKATSVSSVRHTAAQERTPQMKRYVTAVMIVNILKGLELNILRHAAKYRCVPHFTGREAGPTILSLTGNGNGFSVCLVRFVLARGCKLSNSCGTLRLFIQTIF